MQIVRDPKDIQDTDLEELLPRKNNISTVSSNSSLQYWWTSLRLNTNPMAACIQPEKRVQRMSEGRKSFGRVGSHLLNSQLSLCFDQRSQEGVLLIPKSLPCKLWGIPRIFRIQISKSFFQGRIISPQFLRSDGVSLHRIPIWRLNKNCAKS
mgnify:CR=1 FL=1